MSSIAAAIASMTLLVSGEAPVAPGVDVFEVHVADNVQGAPEVAASDIDDESGTKETPPVVPTCQESMESPCVPVEACEPDPTSASGFTTHMYTPNVVYWVAAECTGPKANDNPRPTLPALVLRAFQRVPLPEPRLSIQPPKGRTLVGLETIFSTEAEPFTRTLTLLGRRVELRIEARDFRWLHGDSTSHSTDWPGKPWNADQPDIDGYVTHTYEHTGTVRPSVEVTWSAEFRVNGGQWQPVDGTVTRAGSPVTLQILEGEPVLNSY